MMRTFCIVLPESPERTAVSQKHFAQVGLEQVTFFDGIHAERFGLKTIFPYERDNPGSGFNMGFKCVGIWLSHYLLWSALNQLPEPGPFLVLESDAKFPQDWRAQLDRALADTPPDFDALYVGSCCVRDRPSKRLKGSIYACSQMCCTHAILWAKKALPVLLQTQRRCYAPIDISLTLHSLPVLKSYVVLPRIIEQFDTIIAP